MQGPPNHLPPVRAAKQLVKERSQEQQNGRGGYNTATAIARVAETQMNRGTPAENAAPAANPLSVFDDETLGDYMVPAQRKAATQPEPKSKPAPVESVAPPPVKGAMTLNDLARRVRGRGIGERELDGEELDELDEGWSAGELVRSTQQIVSESAPKTGAEMAGVALSKMKIPPRQ